MKTLEVNSDHQREDNFLERLHEIVDANLQNEAFDVDHLCRSLRMSRSKVHRVIKSLTGKSTSICVRSIRLYPSLTNLVVKSKRKT